MIKKYHREPPQPKEDDTISAEIDQQESNKKLTESEYFQNFQSDVEVCILIIIFLNILIQFDNTYIHTQSLSAFKLKVEELVNDYMSKFL